MLAVYAAWQVAYPSYTIHYRLSLTATVDGKSVMGSGVITVEYTARPNILHNERVGARAHGQAVMLDLGKRGALFALLATSPNSHSAATMLIPNAWWQRHFVHPDNMRLLKTLRGSKNLSFEMLPMLVRFRDINAPVSVELVDPNDLSASFGSGVKLDGALIEITDQPVTLGLNKKLTWLESGYEEKLLDNSGQGKPLGDLPPTATLTFGDVWRIRK